jgi:TRAP-type C4-dicarboxylate transport system permease large subunit
VITVLCIMLGCITPPVGVVVFSLAGSHREVPMYTIFKGVLPFVLTMVIFLVILIFVPQIATWLPSLATGGG